MKIVLQLLAENTVNVKETNEILECLVLLFFFLFVVNFVIHWNETAMALFLIRTYMKEQKSFIKSYRLLWWLVKNLPAMQESEV